MIMEDAVKAGRKLLVTILVVILIGIVVLLILPKRKEKLKDVSQQVISVRTVPVLVSDLPDVAIYTGRIEAERVVRMAAEQSGRVVGLGVEKGAAVTNGQMLLKVDDRMFAATLERAAAALKQVSDDFKRMEELKKSGAVSASDYENLATQKQLAEVAFKQAQVDLERCSVVSALDGLAEDRLVEVGEYVNPGMPLFTLVKLDPVKLVLDIPESDIFAAKPGQDIRFFVDGLSGLVVTGRVTYVASVADSRSNTYRVEALVGNADHLLKPGIIGKIPFTRRVLTGAVNVPMLALIPDKGLHLAYVEESGHAVQRQVKISGMVNNLAAIAEGLKPGEKVIVEGHRLVADGSPVTETSREGAPGKTTESQP
jgi:membrane fusion protein (multidrug efflux system)